MNKQYKYISNLPENIQNSLEWYTGGNFDSLNNALRNDKILTEKQQEHFNNLNLAFAGVPRLEEQIIVYKGLDSSRVYSDKAFISTTTNYKKALEFTENECCILVIVVARGSKILPLKNISRYSDELEILLDRNNTLTVTDQEIKTTNQTQMKLLYCTYNIGIPLTKKQDVKKISKDLDNSEKVTKITQIFPIEEIELYDSKQELLKEIKKIYKQLYPELSINNDIINEVLNILWT